MNKRIRNKEELLQEQERLLLLLKGQEALIKEDLAGVKEGLKPVGKVVKVVNKMTSRDQTGPLFNFGLEFGIDLVVRKFLLAKAGWFTRILVPFLMKNYSSHLISEEKRTKLVKKIQDLFKKVRPEPSKEAEEEASTNIPPDEPIASPT